MSESQLTTCRSALFVTPFINEDTHSVYTKMSNISAFAWLFFLLLPSCACVFHSSRARRRVISTWEQQWKARAPKFECEKDTDELWLLFGKERVEEQLRLFTHCSVWFDLDNCNVNEQVQVQKHDQVQLVRGILISFLLCIGIQVRQHLPQDPCLVQAIPAHYQAINQGELSMSLLSIQKCWTRRTM